jgi:hypothetical protein
VSNLVTSKTQKGSFDRVREFHGIRKPETVEQFRENLVKYFYTYGEDDPQLGMSDHMDIPVNELTEFWDILVEPSLDIPEITPLIQLVEGMGDWYSSDPLRLYEGPGFFLNENNFKVPGTWDYTSTREWIDDRNPVGVGINRNPFWVGLDHKVYRDFFVLTLGEFSGYNEVINV